MSVQEIHHSITLLCCSLPEHVACARIAQVFDIVLEGSNGPEVCRKCIKTIILHPFLTLKDKISLCTKEDLKLLSDLFQRTLLMHAVKCKHTDLVSYLVKNHIAVHSKDQDENTALHIAARKGAIDSLEILSQHLDIHATNKQGETPLHVAIKAGQDGVVSYFVGHWKRLKTSLQEENIMFTPLALATKYGQRGCFEALLVSEEFSQDMGPLVTTIGTLLHVAVMFEQIQMIEYFLYSPKISQILAKNRLTCGEFVELKNVDGRTALSMAASLGDYSIIQLLFEKGASLETKDHNGSRPIHHAALAKKYQAVQVLTVLGAKTKALGPQGISALEIVRGDTSDEGLSISNFLINSLGKKEEFRIDFYQRVPENLVFKGGGPKGIAYAGVVKSLEEKGMLSSIKRLAGTSAGSFPAVFLGIGFTAAQVENLLRTTDLLDFIDPPESKENILKLTEGSPHGLAGAVRSMWNLVRSIRTTKDILLHPFETCKSITNLTGICAGEGLRLWAEQQIKEQTGVDFLTFGELRKWVEQGKKGCRHVTIFAAQIVNPSTMSITKFSSEDPRCDSWIISDGVRCSVSIPGVFLPHTIHMKEGGRRINRLDLGQFVDGGLLNNLPIETFDFKKFQSREINNKKDLFPVFNKRTLGFDLCSTMQPPAKEEPVQTLFQLLKSLMQIYLEAEESIRRLSPYAASRIIKIDTGNVSLLNFKLTDLQKSTLVSSGYRATEAFFNQPLFSTKSSLLTETLLKSAKGYMDLPDLLPEHSLGAGKEIIVKKLADFCFVDGWKPTLCSSIPFLYSKDMTVRKAVTLQFAHKHLQHFSLIRYIDCSNSTTFRNGYAELAKVLNISWNEKTFLSDIHTLLEKRTFSEKEEIKPWFLIWDNYALESPLPPPKNGGVVLICGVGKVAWNGKAALFEIEDENGIYSLNNAHLPPQFVLFDTTSHPMATYPGLSVTGLCTSNTCSKKGELQWIPLGMGTFEMGEVCYTTSCPCCNADVSDIDCCMINTTTYSIKGRRAREGTLTEIVDKKTPPQQGIMITHFSEWKYLKITLNPV